MYCINFLAQVIKASFFKSHGKDVNEVLYYLTINNSIPLAQLCLFHVPKFKCENADLPFSNNGDLHMDFEYFILLFNSGKAHVVQYRSMKSLRSVWAVLGEKVYYFFVCRIVISLLKMIWNSCLTEVLIHRWSYIRNLYLTLLLNALIPKRND